MKSKLLIAVIMFCLALCVGCGTQINNSALLVQVEAAQGDAAPGNMEPANLLVVVTDQSTGVAVTSLAQTNFTVINHFSIPGQTGGFSNNITSFNNVGTGAYHINVGLSGSVPGATWVQGDYLAQVMVKATSKEGQGAATLSVR